MHLSSGGGTSSARDRDAETKPSPSDLAVPEMLTGTLVSQAPVPMLITVIADNIAVHTTSDAANPCFGMRNPESFFHAPRRILR